MEPLGLLFQYFPVWAQVAILIVVLLPALIQTIEALIRAFSPRPPRSSHPHPYHDSRKPLVLRQQLRRKRTMMP